MPNYGLYPFWSTNRAELINLPYPWPFDVNFEFITDFLGYNIAFQKIIGQRFKLLK